jgi:hypothetical protein
VVASIHYGGGLGILYKTPLNLTVTPSQRYITFEHCVITLKNSIDFVLVYRPYPSKVNGFKTAQFLEEFDTFLEELSVNPHQLVLLGDFNVHVDTNKWDAKHFSESLSNCGMRQFISGPTHKHGHTLDLLITRDEDHIVQESGIHPPFYSDHHIITSTLKCDKPPPMKITISSRQYGKMDRNRFRNMLKDHCSNFPMDTQDPNALVGRFETMSTSILDQVCPVTTRHRVIKPRLPWYNDNIHKARRVRRRLERKWRKSRSEVDELVFRTQKDHVAKLITEAKIEYFSNKFSSGTSKDMYATINGLLNNTAKALPVRDSSSDSDLANDFLSFFIQKVEKIRAYVNTRSNASTHTDPTSSTVSCSSVMPVFDSLTSAEVETIIKGFSNKSCSLDTLPCWLIEDNIDIVLPVITNC